MSMRLVKFLSVSGVASRRRAEELVKSGRVAVDGQIVLHPAREINSDNIVEVDGAKVNPETEKVYFMLNKPRSYVCTLADSHAGKLARNLIDCDYRIFSAGRLDKESEGLIIFTNDGDYVEQLTHPRYNILKRYLVTTAAEISESGLERIRSGIEDDGDILNVVSVTKVGDKCYSFVLNEGKKREIRRLCGACKAPVTELKRVSVGSLELGNLATGKYRRLSKEEVVKSLQNLEPYEKN